MDRGTDGRKEEGRKEASEERKSKADMKTRK
jgi:hypothetical protein